ncbi:hypothetical protein EG68_05305 [Paragonimus skrjabini miyazakii]|uniref:Uncharacterized protein n=1 Tax=Paragonimus skrjabini miyazakii TaxID=59628 RepID=A0A8S9Z1M1_9TREM|nr:hypothetical protein EG68_05305 [Paragonimus skrjabini miyazakii]
MRKSDRQIYSFSLPWTASTVHPANNQNPSCSGIRPQPHLPLGIIVQIIFQMMLNTRQQVYYGGIKMSTHELFAYDCRTICNLPVMCSNLPR